MESAPKLRNAINSKVVAILSQNIKKTYPQFQDKNFLEFINPRLDQLILKERVKLIREALEKHLPQDFNKAVNILINSLGKELNLKTGDTDWSSFIIWPQTDYIAKNGLNNFDLSMQALYEMTKRFTSEWAIRSFIEKDSRKTLELLKIWAKDSNIHIRRLASEGIRPRLPWGMALKDFKKNPAPIIEILEILKDDPEIYVRRSVANNINDISKDNPEIVIDLLKKWQKNSNKNRDWIIKHSLRTLFKKGHKEALALVGNHSPKIKLEQLNLTKNIIKIGESLTFLVSIESLIKQKLMIDCKIYYLKASGKHAGKVFKLANKEADKKEKLEVKGRISFKNMTTRKHYPGLHFIEIIVNGESFIREEFLLENIRTLF